MCPLPDDHSSIVVDREAEQDKTFDPSGSPASDALYAAGLPARTIFGSGDNAQ